MYGANFEHAISQHATLESKQDLDVSTRVLYVLRPLAPPRPRIPARGASPASPVLAEVANQRERDNIPLSFVMIRLGSKRLSESCVYTPGVVIARCLSVKSKNGAHKQRHNLSFIFYFMFFI